MSAGDHTALTETPGSYELWLPRNALFPSFQVEVQYVAKRTHQATLKVPEEDDQLRHDGRLPALDLYLALMLCTRLAAPGAFQK